jgi:hypothetical protein
MEEGATTHIEEDAVVEGRPRYLLCCVVLITSRGWRTTAVEWEKEEVGTGE